MMYLKGNGMPVDKKKAKPLCQMAADGGNKDADYALEAGFG